MAGFKKSDSKKRACGGGWGGSASRWSLVELGRKPKNRKLVCRGLLLSLLTTKQTRNCHMAVAVGTVGAVNAVGAADAVGIMLRMPRG